ncbi:MAG: TerC family protein [Chloroflexi bacterium]|nr:TerC family protein [Chloroflexota bacterium]
MEITLDVPILFWILFHVFILGMLALDLGVFHRKSKVISTREALSWSGVWIAVALVFNAMLYVWQGSEVGLEFTTGYLIEKSLSVDNLFVFLLLFTFFKVPAAQQYRVLFWGVIGALVMRGVLIATGAALLSNFHWVIFIFGGFLVVSGIRMAFHNESSMDPNRNVAIRVFRRFVPTTDEYDGGKFIARVNGKLFATPLLVVLVAVEATDLIFAIDSIPAIFAVTDDTFIVYTSNVLAILGLRALYFALAGVISKFHYLKLGLSLVLVFVGAKMLASDVYSFPNFASLGVVAGILTLAVIASFLRPQPDLEPSQGSGSSPGVPSDSTANQNARISVSSVEGDA